MDDLSVRIDTSLSAIGPRRWDALVGDRPLLSAAFLDALHDSGCASARTGWTPTFVTAWRGEALVGAIPLYAKTHSYGEYVFDWAWADAYRRYGRRYYPKLVSAIPFTPAPGDRLITGDPVVADRLVREALAQVDVLGTSSLHVLLPTGEEIPAWAAHGLMVRHGVQFHWHNRPYGDFDAYLAALAREKRKNIRQERRRVHDAGVRFERLTGDAIRPRDWQFFYRCYQNTYREHLSTPYLTLDFFRRLGSAMADSLLLVIGRRDGEAICAALNVYGHDTLWGRYWGAVERVPGLHFETCYYQAIEFCIERGIACFEGGAQGAHKLARGFLPRRTWSAHWIGDRDFAAAIAEFLTEERAHVAHTLDELAEHSPFRRPAAAD